MVMVLGGVVEKSWGENRRRIESRLREKDPQVVNRWCSAELQRRDGGRRAGEGSRD